MNTAIIRVLLSCILTALTTSCRRPSSDSSQSDISQRALAELRQSMNPFAHDQKVHYVRIHLEKPASAIVYSINDRPTTVDALDTTLGKLAESDRNQTLVIELGSGVAPDDLTPLIVLLKKHQFKNAARRAEGNQAIWILE